MRIPFRATTLQTVGVTATSAAATAFNANTSVVRLIADTNCFVVFGADSASPTATSANGVFIVAGVPEYFRVSQGSRIAVIRSTADGNLYVAEMTL